MFLIFALLSALYQGVEVDGTLLKASRKKNKKYSRSQNSVRMLRTAGPGLEALQCFGAQTPQKTVHHTSPVVSFQEFFSVSPIGRRAATSHIFCVFCKKLVPQKRKPKAQSEKRGQIHSSV